jgi:hypothetical protein
MKRIFTTTVLAVLLLFAVALSLSSHAPAAKAVPIHLNGGEGSCSLHTLAGRWGYTYTGTIVGLGPAASVGSFTEDAAGNLKGSQTRSFNGDVENETLVGTVSVNPDCTGAATISVYLNGALERTSVLDTVYVDDGNAFRAIFTTAGVVITADGRKINRE